MFIYKYGIYHTSRVFIILECECMYGSYYASFNPSLLIHLIIIIYGSFVSYNTLELKWLKGFHSIVVLYLLCKKNVASSILVGSSYVLIPIQFHSKFHTLFYSYELEMHKITNLPMDRKYYKLSYILDHKLVNG